jgi:hypothetical protein
VALLDRTSSPIACLLFLTHGQSEKAITESEEIAKTFSRNVIGEMTRFHKIKVRDFKALLLATVREQALFHRMVDSNAQLSYFLAR